MPIRKPFPAEYPLKDPKRYRRVMGIDSCTQSLAWTVVETNRPKSHGKLALPTGALVPIKLRTIISEFPKLLAEQKPSVIFIEKPIYVRSQETARVLSYVVSCIVTIALQEGIEIYEVAPMTWKTWLGYTALTRKFTTSCTKKLGKAPATKFCNDLRKSQTLRVIKHNFKTWAVTDHDINDSCGIALYGYEQLNKPLKLDISKSIAIDQPQLSKLGLVL